MAAPCLTLTLPVPPLTAHICFSCFQSDMYAVGFPQQPVVSLLAHLKFPIIVTSDAYILENVHRVLIIWVLRELCC